MGARDRVERFFLTRRNPIERAGVPEGFIEYRFSGNNAFFVLRTTGVQRGGDLGFGLLDPIGDRRQRDAAAERVLAKRRQSAIEQLDGAANLLIAVDVGVGGSHGYTGSSKRKLARFLGSNTEGRRKNKLFFQ
jgi:hypothetical protein